MSAAQLAFLAGLILVLLAVVAFSAFVLRAAAAGGGTLSAGLLVPRASRAELGRVAFLAHRITGFAIFAFLALHILDIGLYSISHRLYDDVQSLYGTAPLRVFECGLLLAVLFHTGNGLRLLVIDAGRLPAIWAQRLLVVVLVVVAVSGAGGSALILAPLVT
jgi:succinate dehydrogenase / fumarate reductase, cytochrome b subunit